MKEGRCVSRRHFEIVGETLEVKCSSRWCGKVPGVVVIHVFDPSTGELLETKKFRDPSMTKEE